ncbi:ABC transporter ATP-binding protein [Paenibacillus camerounensis]|uniref:ABC transporter ATP-binding protein n=1 Tax=Paenibacillus camerounensis TaxID=1243663 RepID=UPI0005A5D928|nr:ABC transporter ATP-binding protein [Paenibacillus camerounensis]
MNVYLYKKILKYCKPFKWSLLNLFICVLFTSVIGMLYPYIFGLMVDEVFNHKNMHYFTTILIIYGGIFVCEQLMHLTLNATWAYMMTRYVFDIRKSIFSKILNLKAAKLKVLKPGDLLSLVNKDAEEFMNLIHWNVFYAFANSIRLITALVFVLFINVKLAILMLVVVPVAVLVSIWFGKITKKWLEYYRDNYGEFISWVFEILNGIRDVKILSAERNVTRNMVNLLSKLISAKSRTVFIEYGSQRTVSFISLVSDMCLYMVSALLISKGELTIGGFIACIDYFGRANSLLSNLSGANTRFQHNLVSINRCLKLLEEEEESKKGVTLTESIRSIEFNNMSFNYNENMSLLKNISITVKNNETLAIVGQSGGGKSTLLDLILRFEEPDTGEILVNGKDHRSYSIKSLRNKIGIVHQDPIVFNGTIKENLLLGNSKATEDQLWQACEQAFLASFLRELPLGLDTVIGQSGVELSGGQKQRLSIARIFLKNPSVLLLDEATSALDTEAENAIIESWKELSTHRITIQIAHRLNSIKHAEKIAVLHQGIIIACDSHEGLLASCQEYRELHRSQFKTSIGETNEEVQIV